MLSTDAFNYVNVLDKAVAIDAIIAVANIGRESHFGRYLVDASDKQSPVTIPK